MQENPQEKFMALITEQPDITLALEYLAKRIREGKISPSSISYQQTSEEERIFEIGTKLKNTFTFTGEVSLEINLFDHEIARQFSHEEKEVEHYLDPEILDQMPVLANKDKGGFLSAEEWRSLYTYIKDLHEKKERRYR